MCAGLVGGGARKETHTKGRALRALVGDANAGAGHTSSSMLIGLSCCRVRRDTVIFCPPLDGSRAGSHCRVPGRPRRRTHPFALSWRFPCFHFFARRIMFSLDVS